jgi:hypothetical protein
MKSLTFLLIVILFSTHLFITKAQDSSLIAFWSFDDATAFDSSAYQNHGTLHGVTSADNRFGEPNKAFYFDGIDDYISIDSYTNMRPTNDVSIAAWIKTEDSVTTRAIVYDRLQTHDGFGLILNEAGYPRISINGGAGSCTAKDDVDDQSWHFLVGTYSKLGEKIIIYIDAVLSDTSSYSDSIDYTPEPRNQIGRAKEGEDYFNGIIDEIRIYNRKLQQSDIDSLYNNFTFVEENTISEIPIDYNIKQNYPNPFNPKTKIGYSIPQFSNVVVKVFDILGNEIETLVNEEKQTGTYEITWYAENLPSGVYFYRLQAGDFVETKKMVLLR